MTKVYSIAEQKRWLSTLPRRVSSATMIIENAQGEALIVKAGYKTHWTFPGGVIDEGETPMQAACRETREEVGLVVPLETVEFVAVADRKGSLVQTYQFIFKTSINDFNVEDIVLQASEIESYDFVSKETVATHDRYYGKVIEHWANGTTGYLEQTFGE